MPHHVIPFPGSFKIDPGLNHEGPTRGKVSRMARRKRQYGSGCLLSKGNGWAIRWREIEFAPNGTKQRVLRYETLGPMSRREAADVLAQKLAAAGRTGPIRSRVTFRTLVNEWQATVMPMYKPSTQKNHQHITAKHLLPRFGETALCDITRQDVQAYVAHLTQAGYAPKTIDHIHDVLSAVLRTAVKWGHIQENPTHGVDLPALKTVLPKWVLTVPQAALLLAESPPPNPVVHSPRKMTLREGPARAGLQVLLEAPCRLLGPELDGDHKRPRTAVGGATARTMIVPVEARSDIAGDPGVVTRRVCIAADDVDEALWVDRHAAKRCIARATAIVAAFSRCISPGMQLCRRIETRRVAGISRPRDVRLRGPNSQPLRRDSLRLLLRCMSAMAGLKGPA
jgi:hypothetical protein